MKAGISLMLGLLVAFVLVFAYWLRTPHQLGTQWNKIDRALEQVSAEGSAEQVTHDVLLAFVSRALACLSPRPSDITRRNSP
jgi:hypothetical protein